TGSVSLSAGVVTVMPDSTVSQNAAVVSYHNVQGVGTMLDVNLNGVDYDFAPGSVQRVIYSGCNTGGTQLFTNNTNINTTAVGGSGSNTFTGGSGIDIFVGGSGSNTLNGGTGYSILIGGLGTASNTYNESATGSGMIITEGSSNTIDPPDGATGHYS